MLKSYKKFREENGLADVKGTTDFSGSESETLNEMGQLLRDNADSFQRIFQKTLQAIKLSTDEENALKNFIGMVGKLKESPHERKGRMRDPMDNVVVRPHGGADGGDGVGGGSE